VININGGDNMDVGSEGT